MTEVESPLIEVLPEEERRRLLERGVPRDLTPGEALYFAGERSGRVHFVRGGVMKLSARNGEGDEAILGLAVAGELVGDIAAIDGLPQPLDAVAATRASVLGIDTALLVDVLARNAPAAIELARMMAQRARWMADTALERTASEVPARLAGRLLDLADLLGYISDGSVEVEMPIAQEDLGRLAGMCRESACKTLRSFKAAGLLDYKGRRFRILRPDALERIRCAGRASKPSR
ncbi:MAG: Crp/Fnr family transcriptional regulator [Actinomycetota bacterium]|nr:Crp/Fnr family transcriptional regulator [Actinomycetota bacterium]